MKFFNDDISNVGEIFSMVLVAIALCCTPGCGGKQQQNQPLAQTYFKMAFNDLSEDSDPQSFKRALITIDKALAVEERPEYYAFKGTILFKLGDYDACEKCYTQARELHPDAVLSAEIDNNYACFLAQQKKYERAQHIWQELIANPSYQTPEVAWVNLGKLYCEQQNLHAAQSAFKHAATIAPSYIDAHFYLSLVERRLGNAQQARSEADLVLKMEPEHTGANMLVANLEPLGDHV
jgi:Tfp pilus assembly protein PilF